MVLVCVTVTKQAHYTILYQTIIPNLKVKTVSNVDIIFDVVVFLSNDFIRKRLLAKNKKIIDRIYCTNYST